MIPSDRFQQQIENVEKWPIQTGKALYLRRLHGGRLTRDEAIKACCYQCLQGVDTEECLAVFCPLHQFCQWNE